ncbi:MAG: efflux RND transporter periplasmic adaptor subunit [Phycisphaerales bacterium]
MPSLTDNSTPNHTPPAPAPVQTAASSAAAPHAAHDHDATPPEIAQALHRRTAPWKPVAVFTFLAIMGAAVVAVGAFPRAERRREVVETSQKLAAAAKRVQLVAVRKAPATHAFTLPASMQPDMRADVFAQATGYIARRAVDIGARVRAGDLLAEIDIPLVEQDLRRATAALAEAQAERTRIEKNLDLARTTLERWKSIADTKAVSQQDIDERQAAYDALRASIDSAQATIESRRADVERIEQEKTFSRVVAPFDGVITARNIEVGDYILGTGGAKTPLFSLVKSDTLRVYIDVPQAYAYSVRVGQKVKLAIREVTGRAIEGTVTRTSGSLDERTRTLRTEIQIPNAAGDLLAGTYATVQLDVADAVSTVIVPGAAVIVRAEGAKVAIVDEQKRIQYLPVTVGRDLGTEVEITKGLGDASFVVVNLYDELQPGTVVEAIMPKPQ